MRNVQAVQHFIRQNRLADAESALREALRIDPGDIAAKTLLGILKFKARDYEEAETALAEVRRLQPQQPDAIGLLALIHKSKGDYRTAIREFEQLLRLGLASPDTYDQIGSCWLHLGDPNRAGAAFKRAIELDRTSAHSYFNLGLALKLAGSSFETFHTFRRALELDPDRLETYLEVWEQMRRLLNWKEGLPLLEQGHRRHPESVHLTVGLATTYGKLGKIAEAEELFQAAASRNPAALTPYAHWVQAEGRFGDSVPLLLDSLRANPVQGQAFYNLAVAKCFEIDGKPLSDLALALLDNPRLVGEERMFLHYALAKSSDADKRYGDAMRHYDLANDAAYKLYNEGMRHDETAVENERKSLEKIYTRDSIRSLAKHGSRSNIPIFIVGMIRTGTTLLDQILSSHPAVRSSGEQPFWRISAGPVNHRWLATGCDPSDLTELAQRYLDILRASVEDSAKPWDQKPARVTDKMPTNFYHLGLMSSVFPNSKIVHIRRSPIDTGVSIYTTFLGSGTPFAYDQENIVAYYRSYLRLMELWRTVLPPGQMIEIDYEELVSNKEQVLRKLLPFCGLEWDEAVLHHEENRSQVTTPSLWTARQPVTAASIDRWRKYEPWLGKLLELKDLSHPPIAPTGYHAQPSQETSSEPLADECFVSSKSPLHGDPIRPDSVVDGGFVPSDNLPATEKQLTTTDSLAPAIRATGEELTPDVSVIDLVTIKHQAAQRVAEKRHAEAIALLESADSDALRTDDEALNILGICRLAIGKPEDAEAAFRELIELTPGSAPAHANLGMALRLQNRGEEALIAFQKALALDPEQPANHLQTFKQLFQLCHWEEAKSVIEAGARKFPRSVLLAEALATAYGRLDQPEAAERIFRQIVPAIPSAGLNYSDWLQERGRFEDSAAVLQDLLRRDPFQGAAYRALVEIRRFELDGRSFIEFLPGLFDNPNTGDAARMHIAFALGKIYDHEKDYAAAMRWFDRANSIAYRNYPACRTFSHAWAERDPVEMAKLYSADFMKRSEGLGSRDARPIFIVGMIRSGTTLLDQIVSAHPDVVSVGEGTFWNTEIDAVHPRWSAKFPTEPEVRSIAERYLRSTRVDPSVARFTDKMPLNYRNLGLIHTVFPQARILHIRRDPFDTCLSIYSTFFAGGPSFAYNQENIAAFYRAYLRYMNHWRTVLPPDRFFELDYESLVTDPESLTRQIVSFLGLPWGDDCLRPEANSAQVSTPSRWQARQPIYRSSLRKRPAYGDFAPGFTDL